LRQVRCPRCLLIRIRIVSSYRKVKSMSLQKGNFYNTLTSSRGDDDALKSCMEETVSKLLDSDTSQRKPGFLLGKIQSGKTRAFIGVIALAFDNNYDVAIILTKGTKALAEQTIQRLKETKEGLGSFEDSNQIQIHDIMSFPDNLPEFVLTQKLVLVSKKEDDNLNRLLKTVTEFYPNLKDKKTLIIDDEADFASISFKKEKESGLIKQRTIASQIDDIRNTLKQSDFLQVTATPYSLYLQPNYDDGPDGIFLPKRPEFTVTLPTHGNYVGGDYYFIESENEDSTAFHVYDELPVAELEVLSVKKKLKRADRRSLKIEEVFTSPHTRTLRNSIVNFIVGGCIRRLQQERLNLPMEHYSLVIHTDIHKISHSWQEDVVKRLNEELINLSKNNHELFEQLLRDAYGDMKPSIELGGFHLPSFPEVLESVSRALNTGMLFVQTVNSEGDVKALLDSRGQLKLWAPLNIFIGGQILDRGITIKHMIGFFYGRNPGKFQQDTVLQHSRMYGARSKEDLAVTRFYTTGGIHEIMRRIHEFDEALRREIKRMLETGSLDGVIYFLRKDDDGKLVPCSPNKLMLSKITTLRAYTRLLPFGFQTKYKSSIAQVIRDLDQEILGLSGATEEGVLVPVTQALSILDKINQTFVYEDLDREYRWDVKGDKASLERLAYNSEDPAQRDMVWILTRTNKANRRKRDDGVRFFDAPDTSQREGVRAKELAINIPVLMLLKHEGTKEQGWKGSPFWWPVIVVPLNTPTTIFAGDTLKISSTFSKNTSGIKDTQLGHRMS